MNSWVFIQLSWWILRLTNEIQKHLSCFVFENEIRVAVVVSIVMVIPGPNYLGPEIYHILIVWMMLTFFKLLFDVFNRWITSNSGVIFQVDYVIVYINSIATPNKNIWGSFSLSFALYISYLFEDIILFAVVAITWSKYYLKLVQVLFFEV